MSDSRGRGRSDIPFRPVGRGDGERGGFRGDFRGRADFRGGGDFRGRGRGDFGGRVHGSFRGRSDVRGGRGRGHGGVVNHGPSIFRCVLCSLLTYLIEN